VQPIIDVGEIVVKDRLPLGAIGAERDGLFVVFNRA